MVISNKHNSINAEKKKRRNSVIYPNSSKLLISGGVLHNFIEQTFDEFKQAYLQRQPVVQNRRTRKTKSVCGSLDGTLSKNKMPSSIYNENSTTQRNQKISYSEEKLNKIPKVWTNKIEEIYLKHKSEMRLRLSQFSSTAPWRKVVMGSIDQIVNDPGEANRNALKNLKEYLDLPQENDPQKRLELTYLLLNDGMDKAAIQKQVDKHISHDEILFIQNKISQK